MDNISLTQRIVGAIVIISLAIIFIPALLETDKLDPGKMIESPIPEIPREVSTIVFKLNESNGKFEGEGLIFQEDDKNGKSLTPSDGLRQEVESAFKTAENEIIFSPEPEEINDIIKPTEVNDDSTKVLSAEKQMPAESASSVQKPNKAILEDGKQHSWMLQLASFKDEKNAINLRNKLRKKQYVASVSERKFSSGSIWRVRIGPMLSKDNVIKIQAILAKELGMKGLIVRRR